MTLFGGHIMPGIAFLLIGLRWIYCIMMRYFLCKREAVHTTNARRYKSTLMFPMDCWPGFPGEAVVVLTMIIILIIGESYDAYRFGLLRNYQHITMYILFGMIAAVVIMKHYKLTLLPDLDYACFMLCFFMNYIMLVAHTKNKDPLEVSVHTYLGYLYVFGTVIAGLELKFRHNPTLAIFRALNFVVMGSWFIQIAFVLYSPISEPWPRDSHMYLMITTISFAWHVIGGILMIGVITGIVLAKARRMSPAQVSLALHGSSNSTTTTSPPRYKTLPLDREQGHCLLAESDGEYSVA